jgi:beta-phosphoglucomutase
VPSYSLAFLFDMDGVIVHSTPAHTEAWARYLHSHGITIPELEARMLGKRNDEIVRGFFVDENLTDHQVSEHGARKEALYREMMGPVLDQHIIAGLREFLHENREVPIGLATNAEPANVEFVLKGAGIERYFRAVANGHEVERPKPFPDIYLLVARRLGIDPANCVVFEDSLTGVAAARAAGMRVVGLTTTLTDLPEVDLCISDFRDPKLKLWLASIYSLA